MCCTRAHAQAASRWWTPRAGASRRASASRWWSRAKPEAARPPGSSAMPADAFGHASRRAARPATMRSRPRPDMRGFSLLEMAIALAVLALALSALAIPVGAHVHARRVDEARRQLAEARDAVLGFAAAHGRLPCPATPQTRG